MQLIAGVTLVAAAILGSATGNSKAAPPPRNRLRWEGFVFWAVAGFLGVGALLSAIGPFLLPFAILAVFLTARSFPIGVETIGLVAGFGVAGVGIGLLNLGNLPCPSRPFLFPPGQVGVLMECGGPNPVPWLLGGLACIVFGIVVMALFETRMHSRLGH